MKKTIILNLLLALLFASAAKAGTTYIGAGIYASESDIVIETAENFDFQDDDDTVRALFLGYEFTNGIGVELGYYDLGSYSAQVGESSAFVDADALSGSIVASINLIPSLRIYGKAGYAYVENKIEFEQDLIDVVRDNSNTDVLFGIGADFTLGNKIAVYAEYIRFDTEIETDLVGAGLRFKF